MPTATRWLPTRGELDDVTARTAKAMADPNLSPADRHRVVELEETTHQQYLRRPGADAELQRDAEQQWKARLMTEEEYNAARAAENLEQLRHPELQGPEWNLDRNDSYLPYQQAEHEPADKYREREPEAGSDPEATVDGPGCSVRDLDAYERAMDAALYDPKHDSAMRAERDEPEMEAG